MDQFPDSIVMIGCGNMAGSILARWLDCGLDPARVTVIDPGKGQVAPGITLLRELPDRLPESAIILLGVKPQLLGGVAPGLSPLLKADHVVVSMLAGVTVQILRTALGDAARLVRVMPNTPVALGQGVCALYAEAGLGEAQRATVDALMHPLGLVEWVEDEGDFNLITAISGCGPAYVFRFIDALSRAAQGLGMDAAQADRMALATVQGAASLAAVSDESPAILADRVASPGGMTREGLNVLDADDRLACLLADTLRAARDRGEELASAASR